MALAKIGSVGENIVKPCELHLRPRLHAARCGNGREVSRTHFALLRASGTKHYDELLAPFGLDTRDPTFWQTGLSLIERMTMEPEGME